MYNTNILDERRNITELCEHDTKIFTGSVKSHLPRDFKLFENSVKKIIKSNKYQLPSVLIRLMVMIYE